MLNRLNIKKIQKFSNNENEEEKNKNIYLIIRLIYIVFLIYALYLYIKCSELKKNYNIIEGIFAFTMAPFYILYYKLYIKNCL